ncbi:MAG: hypothetical protein KF809_18010 [Chloroflexi bacterium]|nr:hypothetical protein [Chloroflexota bacterium]
MCHGTGIVPDTATMMRYRRHAVSLLSRLPVHPVLLALFAVLSVYAGNLAEVLPIDLGGPFGPLARAVAGAVIALLAGALLFRDWRRGAIVATAVVAMVGLFGRAAGELTGVGIGPEAQLVLWLVLVGVAIGYAIRARESLSTVTLALNTFTLVLVGLTLIEIVPYEAGRAAVQGGTAGGSTTGLVATRHPERDIYLIVLDRYGSDWSIEHRFGITDNDLPAWLASQGFQVLPGARANYRATDFSLSSMLSMDTLDEYSVDPGRASGDRTAARSRLQRPEVAAFLRDQGYTYYQLGSWYGPTQTNELVDVNLTRNTDTELEAVLRGSTILPEIDRLLGRQDGEGDAFRDDSRATIEYQFRQLQRLPSVPGRKLVFAHILLPHPPYVFDAQGDIVVKATAEVVPEARLFADQLAYTNEQVRATVSALLAGPDETDPIVIVMGDEGPFLCRNVDCVDDSERRLGIRFGALGAYYLPDQPDGFLPPDHTHVNTFRRILSAYFGVDLAPLPDRSYDWPDNDHIYDFTDITDRLPLPGSPAHPDGLDLPVMDDALPGASPGPGVDLSLDGDE